tara:strand:+ start:884 stop:1285 length:402 start_codon:yes stop_codon:yes gene_type:complete
MKIDFSGTDSSTGFDPIPEDRYLLEVVGMEERVSGSGNPLISTRFKVVEGDHEGRNVFTNFVLTPNSLWNLRGFLEACGLEDLVSGETDTNEVIENAKGRAVSAYVKIREYQGKKSNDLSGWQASDDSDGLFA